MYQRRHAPIVLRATWECIYGLQVTASRQALLLATFHRFTITHFPDSSLPPLAMWRDIAGLNSPSSSTSPARPPVHLATSSTPSCADGLAPLSGKLLATAERLRTSVVHRFFIRPPRAWNIASHREVIDDIHAIGSDGTTTVMTILSDKRRTFQRLFRRAVMSCIAAQRDATLATLAGCTLLHRTHDQKTGTLPRNSSAPATTRTVAHGDVRHL